MHLSDEQWRLVQPLLPPPSPAARGRPLADERAVLDGILTHFASTSSWYDLPPGDYPSWQTCYRRYRLLKRLGIIDDILRTLAVDLRRRGGFDLMTVLQNRELSFQGSGRSLKLIVAPRWHGTWQLATALLLILYKLKSRQR